MFRACILDILVSLETRFIYLSFGSFSMKKGVVSVQSLDEYQVLKISIKQQCAKCYRLGSKLTKVNRNLSVVIGGLLGRPYTNVIY